MRNGCRNGLLLSTLLAALSFHQCVDNSAGGKFLVILKPLFSNLPIFNAPLYQPRFDTFVSGMVRTISEKPCVGQPVKNTGDIMILAVSIQLGQDFLPVKACTRSVCMLLMPIDSIIAEIYLYLLKINAFLIRIYDRFCGILLYCLVFAIINGNIIDE